MRTAIVHEWLDTLGGSEKVLFEMLAMWPDADVFVLVDWMDERHRAPLRGRRITTSFIQRLPFARKRFRNYLPLFPQAVEAFDLRSYELVISSHHCVAKGVITHPDAVHVSYVHSPMRYAWDLGPQYLGQAGLAAGLLGLPVRAGLHYLRLWDAASASRPTTLVANSAFVARRIRMCWGREATVVHPPVEVDVPCIGEPRGDVYLAASRLVPYKRLDLVVSAFAAMPQRRLVVIGDGPERAAMERLAAGHANISLLGWQPDAVLHRHLATCRALVFPAEEDFGILPVEAQAHGTPVIGYVRGGCAETVLPGVTGVHVREQSVSAVIDAIERSEQAVFDPARIREHALGFSRQTFRDRFMDVVQGARG